jgi:hypothetical protein
MRDLGYVGWHNDLLHVLLARLTLCNLTYLTKTLDVNVLLVTFFILALKIIDRHCIS